MQGNLTADPEIVGNEKNIARFTLAVNDGFGEKEEVHFFDCVAFGKQVETIKQFLTKGKQIIVEGSLRQARWEDKETGKGRSRVEIKLKDYGGFHFVNGGKQSGKVVEAPSDTPVASEETTKTDEGRLF